MTTEKTIALQSKALVVNKAEIDAFLELSCFFTDPADVGSLNYGSSAWVHFYDLTFSPLM